eukprot:g38611.t1
MRDRMKLTPGWEEGDDEVKRRCERWDSRVLCDRRRGDAKGDCLDLTTFVLVDWKDSLDAKRPHCMAEKKG